MGKYDNNPIIECRYDAYGRQVYWENGYSGQGVNVAVIDDYDEEHGHQMASVRDYIAPDCELLKINMMGDYYALIDGIKSAISHKADIISISRSVDFETKPLSDAVKMAFDAGILIVCSAGNTGEKIADTVDIKRYPAAYPETVSVLSVDNSLVASVFSSHGSTADVTGFGQNVLVKNSKGEEMLVSGTSPTTAAIAFSMALYLSMLKAQGKPKPPAQELITFVRQSTVDYGIVGRDNMTGYGFFTLDKAEHERVRMMILDADGDGLSDRVSRIKAMVASGTSYETAEASVSRDYFIVGYEVLNGVNVPVYGGRKPF